MKCLLCFRLIFVIFMYGNMVVKWYMYMYMHIFKLDCFEKRKTGLRCSLFHLTKWQCDSESQSLLQNNVSILGHLSVKQNNHCIRQFCKTHSTVVNTCIYQWASQNRSGQEKLSPLTVLQTGGKTYSLMHCVYNGRYYFLI